MKTMIEMAREAGFDEWQSKVLFDHLLEAFAELVRADEREKYKWDIHSCGPDCKRYACVSMREAVEAEREACAKVCKETDDGTPYNLAEECAAAIRARSNT